MYADFFPKNYVLSHRKAKVDDEEIDEAVKAAKSAMIDHQAFLLAVAAEKNYDMDKYRDQVMKNMLEAKTKKEKELAKKQYLHYMQLCN